MPKKKQRKPKKEEELKMREFIEAILMGKYELPTQIEAELAVGKGQNKSKIKLFRTGKDAIAYHMLTGNDKLIAKVLDKFLPTLIDATSKGEQIGGFIVLPEKDSE